MRKLAVVGVFAALSLGLSATGSDFAVYFIAAPSAGTVYAFDLDWTLGILELGLAVELAGGGQPALSPSLGLPLLYGTLNQVRIEYDFGLAFWDISLGWRHVCFYSLHGDGTWTGQGVELFWFRTEF